MFRLGLSFARHVSRQRLARPSIVLPGLAARCHRARIVGTLDIYGCTFGSAPQSNAPLFGLLFGFGDAIPLAPSRFRSGGRKFVGIAFRCASVAAVCQDKLRELEIKSWNADHCAGAEYIPVCEFLNCYRGRIGHRTRPEMFLDHVLGDS